MVSYEANPNDIATTTTVATVAPITKPTQGEACEGDTRVRGYKTSSYLPSLMFVVRVSDPQTLGGEGEGQNLSLLDRGLGNESSSGNTLGTDSILDRTELLIEHQSAVDSATQLTFSGLGQLTI